MKNIPQLGARGVIMWVKLSVAVTVIVIFVFTLVVIPPKVVAQTISCSVSPSTWAVGTITAGERESTFVSGTQGYFTLTNTGNVTEDFTIEGTDATGSTVTWTLTKTPDSANQYSLGFGQATGGSYETECADYTEFDTNDETLTTGLVADGTFLFDLELFTYAGTDVTQLMRATVTITAVESSG